MTHFRTVALRRISSLKSLNQRQGGLHTYRCWRPVRLFATRVHVRSRTLWPRRRCVAVHSYGQEIEVGRTGDALYKPNYTEPMSYALVNAFPELNMMEEEMLKPLPTNVESIADDPSLGNPKERLERMGTGWFGVILDFEGAVVQSALDAHIEAWIQLAEEEGKPRPLESVLRRAASMKAEQAISEVLCWERESSHVRRMALRKEELFIELTSYGRPNARDGLYRLLETLKQHNIPVAVCSTERTLVYDSISSLGLYPYIDEIVTAEDVYRCAPDPEAYAYAAQKLNRPPFRCVVIGASNISCEAAHDCGMKCIATANTQPLYELNAADLVIKQLEELSFVNLKQVFRHEEYGTAQDQGELEGPGSMPLMN